MEKTKGEWKTGRDATLPKFTTFDPQYPRSVEVVQGVRKKDLKPFWALVFRGPNHTPVFLTTAQLKTVSVLLPEAKQMADKMPRQRKEKK